MTIKEAINEAKLMFNWNIVPHEPTSVRVIFNEYKKENSHATACAIVVQLLVQL